MLKIYKIVLEIKDIEGLFDSSAKIFRNSCRLILGFVKIDLYNYKIPPHVFMALYRAKLKIEVT